MWETGRGNVSDRKTYKDAVRVCIYKNKSHVQTTGSVKPESHWAAQCVRKFDQQRPPAVFATPLPPFQGLCNLKAGVGISDKCRCSKITFQHFKVISFQKGGEVWKKWNSLPSYDKLQGEV